MEMTSLIGSVHSEIGVYNDQQASLLCVKAAVKRPSDLFFD